MSGEPVSVARDCMCTVLDLNWSHSLINLCIEKYWKTVLIKGSAASSASGCPSFENGNKVSFKDTKKQQRKWLRQVMSIPVILATVDNYVNFNDNNDDGGGGDVKDDNNDA